MSNTYSDVEMLGVLIQEIEDELPPVGLFPEAELFERLVERTPECYLKSTSALTPEYEYEEGIWSDWEQAESLKKWIYRANSTFYGFPVKNRQFTKSAILSLLRNAKNLAEAETSPF